MADESLNWDSGETRIWEGWFKYTFGKGNGVDDRWHFATPSEWQFFYGDEKETKDDRDRKKLSAARKTLLQCCSHYLFMS